MRRLFGCPDIVSLTEKFLMARICFLIFTKNRRELVKASLFTSFYHVFHIAFHYCIVYAMCMEINSDELN